MFHNTALSTYKRIDRSTDLQTDRQRRSTNEASVYRPSACINDATKTKSQPYTNIAIEQASEAVWLHKCITSGDRSERESGTSYVIVKEMEI